MVARVRARGLSINRLQSASTAHCQQTCSGSAELLTPTMQSVESLQPGDVPHRGKRRTRRLWVYLGLAVFLLLCITVAVLMVTLRQGTNPLRETFISRCELLQGYNCQDLWAKFQQAYVGQDPCKIPWEAYDPFIAAATFEPACNRMMFWSKTKDVVHDFTDKRECFVTMEDTVLGSLLDDLTWCGKEGSSETFTSNCPGWTECENNPVRSFWSRASSVFADKACGDVSAMLNGSLVTPFSPTSIFGGIEVKRLNSTRVKSLKVILVTQEIAVSNCTNASFQDLQKELDEGIKYDCTEVTESHLQECSSDPEKPCGPVKQTPPVLGRHVQGFSGHRCHMKKAPFCKTTTWAAVRNTEMPVNAVTV